jgi:MFS family permease
MSSRYAHLIAAVAAISGLLFGFDTAVINGALIFLRRELSLSTGETELATASLLVGCAAGAAVAGWLTDRWGGVGPGVWVGISELFPARIRGRAMSIATVSLRLAWILVTATFLSLVEAIGSTAAFWLYAAASGLNFLFVWRVMPETKGRSLEEIERSW